MVNKNKTTDLYDTVNSMNEKVDFLYENVTKSNCDKTEILDMQKSLNEVKSSIKDLSYIYNKYCNKHDSITENINENSRALFDSYKVEMDKAFNKAKEIADIVDKKYNNFENSINKLNNDNYITKLINEYNDYLYNLSITEICLVINISSCFLVLTCLITILFAVYGNFIIDKLSLQDKYPKLATFIKLRVKLQHTYVLINTLVIVVVLILMIITNYITLIQ